MLKKKALRKIFITTFTCFTLLVLYIIPTKVNDNFLKTDIDVIYTSSVYNSEIYLLGENNYLVKTNLMLKEDDVDDKIEELLEHLKIDSKFTKPVGLKGIIPKDTEINEVTVTGNRVIIDFDDNLLKVDKKLEERLIESIVYSTTSISGIDEVIITINGEKLSILPESRKSLPDTLTRDFGINKVYDITNRNGIQKVILYYTENISNNNYYVPVTKYLNDDRDKIKIIIDELTSYNTYNTNLMSYLNSNTELLAIEEQPSILELTFNSYIFSDVTDKEILEEVIYTICLSVKDNYNVDEVVIKNEEEPILSTVLKELK